MNLSLMKRTSAFLPVLMSLTALSLVLTHYALYGIVHQEDEGTAAHLFQLLLAAQLPIVGFFALRWIPVHPGRALLVLAIQAGAGLCAIGSVLVLT